MINENVMHTFSFHVLRVATAITFIWIGILIIKSPESWGGYLEPWAVNLLPVSVTTALVATAFVDVAIGVLLLIDWYAWVAALVASIHLLVILITSGITDITVRDIAILGGTIALFVETMPLQLKIKFLKSHSH